MNSTSGAIRSRSTANNGPPRSSATSRRLGSGEAGLVTDSSGMVAVVLNRSSAASQLGLGAGVEVRLHPGGSEGGVTTPVSIGRPELMRPATVIVISILLLLIVGAAFYQIVIQGG